MPCQYRDELINDQTPARMRADKPAAASTIQWQTSVPVLALGSGLMTQVLQPCCLAADGSEAAGWTVAEVPTTSIRSARTTLCMACSHSRSGRPSPNHTTPGRISPPQCWQCGGGRCPSATAVANRTGLALRLLQTWSARDGCMQNNAAQTGSHADVPPARIQRAHADRQRFV